MLIKSGIHLKTMLVAIYAKMFITFLFQQFTKTLNRIFYLKRTNENLETCLPVWFEQLKELKHFWGTFNFYMAAIFNETGTQKVLLWIPARFQYFLHLK